MAHRKSGGTTHLGRDSESKRLGVKVFGGERIGVGEIVVRQRGTKFHPGEGIRRGEDDTLYAVAAGTVSFFRKKVKNFTGKLARRIFVSVQNGNTIQK